MVSNVPIKATMAESKLWWQDLFVNYRTTQNSDSRAVVSFALFAFSYVTSI